MFLARSGIEVDKEEDGTLRYAYWNQHDRTKQSWSQK